MVKDIPKEFLREYRKRQASFEKALDAAKAEIQLRLGQLATSTGTRGRITDARVKRPRKIWARAKKAGLSSADAFAHIEDLLGIRIVCNNLSDVDPLVEMIRKQCSSIAVVEVKDMVASPAQSGYRATHVRAEFRSILDEPGTGIPCEIQIRTLAQDAWARLSRDDLYGKDVPESIQKLAKALSTQLSAIDDIAQLIRNELNQCPQTADKLSDTDKATPQRLALLFKDTYKKDIFEWTLIEWKRLLDEAEVESIGEVRALLSDSKVRKAIDKAAVTIRNYAIDDGEWAVHSALVGTEITTKAGMNAVRDRIKSEWDEIVATARNEVLAEMPDTIDGFVEMLKEGDLPVDALRELGALSSCFRCGTDILQPDVVAQAVLEYYGVSDTYENLESLIEEAADSYHYSGPEVESVDYSGACQYCGHQMSKDD